MVMCYSVILRGLGTMPAVAFPSEQAEAGIQRLFRMKRLVIRP